MKPFNDKKLLVFMAVLAAAASAQMDMDMDMDMERNRHDSPMYNDEVAQNITDLTPVAHEMKHLHGVPILKTKLTPAERLYWEQYNTTTYFTVESGKKPALWYHCFSIGLCFIFLYPISMMLSSVKSRWHIPALTIYNIVLISSLLSLKIFGSSVPDLYPKNAYARMSWILFFATIIQYVVAILYAATRWVSDGWLELGDESNQPFIPLEDLDIDRDTSESISHRTLIDSPNRSSDENQEDDLERGSSLETFCRDEQELESLEENINFNGSFNKVKSKGLSATRRDDLLSKLFGNSTVRFYAEKFHTLITILFSLMNIPMFAYLFIYVVTGLTVGSLLGQENHIFNLLAHLIKGGVFVSLGIFSLSRYCGCLSKSGLAWNKAVILKDQVNTRSIWYKLTPQGMITMEFFESFLIFFYGITNVFLERLGSRGGPWSAQDLQHASIAFMFIGSGLCGLVTEYILSEWRLNQVLSNTKNKTEAIYAGTPGYSPNPFPAFTIFWTGILMSQHQQPSEISTIIHMQWGYLLSFGSFFRLMTFGLLMMLPNKNSKPARPFTELITSFALICGGFIFMESNGQSVEALEYRGLTNMFTLNVNVGIVALIMAWEMVLLIWKGRLESSKRV